MLILVYEDGCRSIWAEEPVHHESNDAGSLHKLPWVWLNSRDIDMHLTTSEGITSNTWQPSMKT